MVVDELLLRRECDRARRPPLDGAGVTPFRIYEAQMDTDDDHVDLTPLVPLAELPPYFDDVPEPPAPTRRRSAPAPSSLTAYGLVGVPHQTVTTRTVKTFAFGAAVGAVIAAVLSWSWLGRRRV